MESVGGEEEEEHCLSFIRCGDTTQLGRMLKAWERTVEATFLHGRFMEAAIWFLSLCVHFLMSTLA